MSGPEPANNSAEQLLAEFRRGYEAGEPPHLGELLARAPEGKRQTLRSQIDSYLMQAPRRKWDPVAYELSSARLSVERVWESLEGTAGSWPELLPRLRNEAKVERGTLVQRLAEALGFGSERDRVLDYYHRMEHGRLDAAGVSDRVLQALAGIVGSSLAELRAAGRGGRAGAESGEVLSNFARMANLDSEYLVDADAVTDTAEDDNVEDFESGDDLSDESGVASAPAAEPSPGHDELDSLFLDG